MNKINIFWFRRDLRVDDNPAFFHALQKGNVLPVFIFDTQILERLPDMNDSRITFIFSQMQKLDKELEKHGSAIKIYEGIP